MFFLAIVGVSKKNREVELFLIISHASDIKQVNKEISEFFDSMKVNLWGKFYQDFSKKYPKNNLEDFEDAYYEGWERILKNRIFYDEKSGSPYNWAYTVMKNSAINYFKKWQTLPGESSYQILEIIDCDEFNETNFNRKLSLLKSNNIEDRIEDLDSATIVAMTKNFLSKNIKDSDAEIFSLRVDKEMNFQEIANLKHMPISSVHNSYKSTLMKIRQYFVEQNISI